MGRTVSYSVVKRNNPLDQDAVPKFYAQAQANGHVEIREMADRIQKTCTVTRADVMSPMVVSSNCAWGENSAPVPMPMQHVLH